MALLAEPEVRCFCSEGIFALAFAVSDRFAYIPYR